MRKSPSGSQILRWLFVVAAVALAIVYLPKSSFFPRTALGPVIHEETSQFSKIRVRGKGHSRHLLFVTDIGKEQLQSSVDLEHPGILQLPYTKRLMASCFFRFPQERILIVGLGGGGMIGFFRENFPEWKVEAVEIDPAVIRIADEIFGVREEGKLMIYEADAFQFLQEANGLYDAIYMDAFLKPSVDRDATGKTARLKTESFLRTIRERLVPDGLLACNLIRHRQATAGDISALRAVFPTVKIFPVPGTGNIAVIASKRADEWSPQDLGEAAALLQERIPVGIPWQEMADSVKP